MKKILKSKIFYFVLGAIIFGSLGVYAATQILSKDISYTKTDGTTTSVETALNDLYAKSSNIADYVDGTYNLVQYTGNFVAGAGPTLNFSKGIYYVVIVYSNASQISSVNNYSIDEEISNVFITQNNIVCERLGGKKTALAATTKKGSYYSKVYVSNLTMKCTAQNNASLKVFIPTTNTTNNTIGHITNISSIKIQ